MPTQPSAQPGPQPPLEPDPSTGDEQQPAMPWPPTESGAPTEPPRDLPMPLAGAPVHLTNSAQQL